ncbi:MAG: replication-relaxation family protein [Pseudomonadota bacterium]
MFDIDPTQRRHRSRPESSGIRVSLKPRDRRWLEALATHGPLSSRMLHAFTATEKPSLKSALKRLTDLTHETNTPHGSAYLYRPPAQLNHYKAKNRPAIYDLTPAAYKALEREKADLTRSTGPFWHQCMVAETTASIELACLDCADRSFISGQYILDRAEARLAVDMSITNPRTEKEERHRLIPDAIFAIEYLINGQKKYRSFTVECDRGTEPITSKSFARKSYYRSLLQYDKFLRNRMQQKTYGLKSSMRLVYVFSSEARQKSFDRLKSELNCTAFISTIFLGRDFKRKLKESYIDLK